MVPLAVCAESPFRSVGHGSWRLNLHQAALRNAARPLGRLRSTNERCTRGHTSYTGRSSRPSRPSRSFPFEAPSEWIDICRLQCVLQTGPGPRSAVAACIRRLANRLTAIHVYATPFLLNSKAGSVGISACLHQPQFTAFLVGIWKRDLLWWTVNQGHARVLRTFGPMS